MGSHWALVAAARHSVVMTRKLASMKLLPHIHHAEPDGFIARFVAKTPNAAIPGANITLERSVDG